MLTQILTPEVLNQITESFAEGLTQSEIMTRMNCVRKWYFRYVVKTKKQGSFSWALLLGDAVHRMLEEYYRGRYLSMTFENPLEVPPFRFEDDVILQPYQKDEHEYYRGLAGMLVEQHNRYWESFDGKMIIELNEEEIDYEHRGFRLRAKIDLVIRTAKSDGLFVMDHKTAYDFNQGLFAGWNFRFQFLFYAWMFWKVYGIYPAGLYVNALRKPAERRSVKKQETVKDFLKRIENNIIVDPDKYFKRERLPFDHTTLDRFERYTLDPAITAFEQISGCRLSTWTELQDEDMMSTLESLLISMNTDHCWNFNRPCEFLDLCANDFQDFSAEYIPMATKHPELHR